MPSWPPWPKPTGTPRSLTCGPPSRGTRGPGGVRLEAAVWIVTAFLDAPRTAAR